MIVSIPIKSKQMIARSILLEQFVIMALIFPAFGVELKFTWEVMSISSCVLVTLLTADSIRTRALLFGYVALGCVVSFFTAGLSIEAERGMS